MVIINGFFYNLHVLLGDPVVPGWITPAIPIITAFLTDGYEMGPERTQALIAMQLILALSSWCSVSPVSAARWYTWCQTP